MIITKKLLLAIMLVESNLNPNAIGDGGKAYGILQIHEPYLHDANELSIRGGGKRYTHDDMFNQLYAINVFFLYMERYATEERLGRKPTQEDIARIHNGGLHGWKRESTEKYWEKVQVELAILNSHTEKELIQLWKKALGVSFSSHSH